MCSTGGPTDFDIDWDKVFVSRYKCRDCGGEFKGMGKAPTCPACASENLDPIK